MTTERWSPGQECVPGIFTFHSSVPQGSVSIFVNELWSFNIPLALHRLILAFTDVLSSLLPSLLQIIWCVLNLPKRLTLDLLPLLLANHVRVMIWRKLLPMSEEKSWRFDQAIVRQQLCRHSLIFLICLADYFLVAIMVSLRPISTRCLIDALAGPIAAIIDALTLRFEKIKHESDETSYTYKFTND